MNLTPYLAAVPSGAPAHQRQPSDVVPLPKRERLLRLPEVENRCGIKKSTIYALMKKGEFPRCVQCGARAVAWPESRVDSWIESRTQ